MKTKKSLISKKTTTTKKKKNVAKGPLLKKSATKSRLKKIVPPEITDAYERTRWKKEKREYWSSRFRKILDKLPLKPKAKKTSFF